MCEILRLDWPTYIDLCEGLAVEIAKAQTHRTYVTGPPRGGLIPAVIVSHALGMKFIEWAKFDATLASIKEVLIVDDITCKGETLRHYPAHMKAVIFKRVTSTVNPQIFLKEVRDSWIKFPYEK